MIIYVCVCVCFTYMQILYSCLMAENLLGPVQVQVPLTPRSAFFKQVQKGFQDPPTAEATECECSCHNTNTERCAGSICWCWKIENFTSPAPSCQVEISSFAFVCPSPLRFLAAEIHPCASWTTSNGWISWKNTTCSRVCPVTATPHPRFESGVWSERTQPDALTIAMRLNPEPRDGIFQERILAV